MAPDYIAGEDIKAGDFLTVGKDGKLYKLDSHKIKRIAEDDFIQALKTNPAYSHISIDREMFLIDEWLKRHPERMKTRRFVLNWLSKKEVPLNYVGNSDVPESMRKYIK